MAKLAVIAVAVAVATAETWNDTFTEVRSKQTFSSCATTLECVAYTYPPTSQFNAKLWTQQNDIEHCSDGACFYADPKHLFYAAGGDGEGLLVGERSRLGAPGAPPVSDAALPPDPSPFSDEPVPVQHKLVLRRRKVRELGVWAPRDR